MTTPTKSLFLAAGVCVFASSLASAQTLAGTVRDTSGAVLPGVTVEASSPALIEKTRSAVTDNTGQYQIANLPPGRYGVVATPAAEMRACREEGGNRPVGEPCVVWGAVLASFWVR